MAICAHRAPSLSPRAKAQTRITQRMSAIVIVVAAATAPAWLGQSTPTNDVYCGTAKCAPMLSSRPLAGGSTSRFGWTSLNWSGYAQSGGPYSAISGSWTIPAVGATSGATFSSTWIGIDGFTNQDLIQTGTEQDYYGGAPHYFAWWEILPASEISTGMPVHPGDHIMASITQTSPQPPQWVITIRDTTTGQSFSTTQLYYGPATSTEWIQEAPTVNGNLAPLAHYGKVVFDRGTVDGTNPHLLSSQAGQMIQGRKVSTPSLSDTDTDGFAVAYGSSRPTIPAS